MRPSTCSPGPCPPHGLLLAWGDSAEVMARAAHAACPVVTYGLGADNAWRLLTAAPASGGETEIRLRAPGGGELAFFSPLAGEHNALNTTATVAVLCAAGLPPAQAAFQGVRRRQEVRGLEGGVVMVDDFAHHPTAVRETIRAVAGFGLPGWTPRSGRLAAVFEPRTNTSKRSLFQDDYALAFDQADLVFLREPPGVENLDPAERFSSARLAQALGGRGLAVAAFPDSDALLAALLAELKPGDLALVMSNGSFDNLHERLLAGLRGR